MSLSVVGGCEKIVLGGGSFGVDDVVAATSRDQHCDDCDNDGGGSSDCCGNDNDNGVGRDDNVGGTAEAVRRLLLVADDIDVVVLPVGTTTGRQRRSPSSSHQLPWQLRLLFGLTGGAALQLSSLALLAVVNDRVRLQPKYLSAYGAVAFLPYSFKPLYALLTERIIAVVGTAATQTTQQQQQYYYRRYLLASLFAISGWCYAGTALLIVVGTKDDDEGGGGTTTTSSVTPTLECFAWAFARGVADAWSQFLLGAAVVELARLRSKRKSDGDDFDGDDDSYSYRRIASEYQSDAAACKNWGSLAASLVTFAVFVSRQRRRYSTSTSSTAGPLLSDFVVNGLLLGTATLFAVAAAIVVVFAGGELGAENDTAATTTSSSDVDNSDVDIVGSRCRQEAPVERRGGGGTSRRGGGGEGPLYGYQAVATTTAASAASSQTTLYDDDDSLMLLPRILRNDDRDRSDDVEQEDRFDDDVELVRGYRRCGRQRKQKLTSRTCGGSSSIPAVTTCGDDNTATAGTTAATAGADSGTLFERYKWEFASLGLFQLVLVVAALRQPIVALTGGGGSSQRVWIATMAVLATGCLVTTTMTTCGTSSSSSSSSSSSAPTTAVPPKRLALYLILRHSVPTSGFLLYSYVYALFAAEPVFLQILSVAQTAAMTSATWLYRRYFSTRYHSGNGIVALIAALTVAAALVSLLDLLVVRAGNRFLWENGGGTTAGVAPSASPDPKTRLLVFLVGIATSLAGELGFMPSSVLSTTNVVAVATTSELGSSGEEVVQVDDHNNDERTNATTTDEQRYRHHRRPYSDDANFEQDASENINSDDEEEAAREGLCPVLQDSRLSPSSSVLSPPTAPVVFGESLQYASFLSCIDFGSQVGDWIAVPIVSALGVTRENRWENLDRYVAMCAFAKIASVSFLCLIRQRPATAAAAAAAAAVRDPKNDANVVVRGGGGPRSLPSIS